jgi:hypothetical protein
MRYRQLCHTWLLVNALPTFFSFGLARGPVLQIDEIPGAPGYLAVTTLDYGTRPVDASGDDDVATAFLQVPKAYGRDLEDAVIEHHGADWVRWSGGLFRPAGGVPALAAGETTVTFGPEGYGEWRRVPAATTLRIAAGTTGCTTTRNSARPAAAPPCRPWCRRRPARGCCCVGRPGGAPVSWHRTDSAAVGRVDACAHPHGDREFGDLVAKSLDWVTL